MNRLTGQRRAPALVGLGRTGRFLWEALWLPYWLGSTMPPPALPSRGVAATTGERMPHLLQELDALRAIIWRQRMVILALHWDYAAWTPRAAAFAAGLEKIAAKESKKPALAVMLTGQISPLLRSELEARKFRVFDRVVPGPLK